MTAMSQAAQHAQYTLAEYVELEAGSNVRHEFMDGQIYAMAGGTPEHAALAAAVSGFLFGQLQGKPCRVYSSDLRVGVQATGLVTYPDLSVACDPLERDPRDRNTVLNPVVLVEVTSPGTEAYDRGDKLGHFKQIASVMEILILSHSEPWIEGWSRNGGAWTRADARSGDRVELRSVGCTLDVSAVYASKP